MEISDETLKKTTLQVTPQVTPQVKRLLEILQGEMTIPEKPNSRLQKYRITDKGREIIGDDE